MENREIAIQLSGVKKMYKLGQIGGGTLKVDEAAVEGQLTDISSDCVSKET